MSGHVWADWMYLPRTWWAPWLCVIAGLTIGALWAWLWLRRHP